MVKDRNFKEFVRLVQKCKGKYTLPSDFPLRTTILDKGYTLVREQVYVSVFKNNDTLTSD